jgi:hypothetical protein
MTPPKSFIGLSHGGLVGMNLPSLLDCCHEFILPSCVVAIEDENEPTSHGSLKQKSSLELGHTIVFSFTT